VLCCCVSFYARETIAPLHSSASSILTSHWEPTVILEKDLNKFEVHTDDTVASGFVIPRLRKSKFSLTRWHCCRRCLRIAKSEGVPWHPFAGVYSTQRHVCELPRRYVSTQENLKIWRTQTGCASDSCMFPSVFGNLQKLIIYLSLSVSAWNRCAVV